MVFHPMLAEVVGSSLNPLDVIVPLRELAPGVQCRTETVLALDLPRNEVEYEGFDGHVRRMGYDHLVLSCGTSADLNVVPGMSDYSLPLKTIGDAVALRGHVLQQMEKAEVTEDMETRRWLLSFIVVGGGYSGVEVAGEINDLLRSSLRLFRRIRGDDVSVSIVHARDHLLPEISAELREFARQKMEGAGIRVILNSRVQRATPEGIILPDGSLLGGSTIVCTIGTTPSRLVDALACAKERGRLLTGPDMRLTGSNTVWAIGDCAQIVNAFDGKTSAPTGQFAERQGRQAALNIARVLRGEPTTPFSFRPLGQLCSIGGHSAVAEFLGFKLSGFPAWFFWRSVYLFKLPSWSRRIRVGFDWLWVLLFPRDLSHLRTKGTDRFSHAHFEPGDYVYRQGDPANSFYAIERGEAEVVRQGGHGLGEEIVAVLGSGSFFGEQALLGNRPHGSSIRARTTLDVLVMGRNVFTQVSAALAPLRDSLAQALRRRRPEALRGRPILYSVLEKTALSELVEAPPQPLLEPSTTLRQASIAFAENGRDFFFVSSDGVHLEGIVTLGGLIHAHNEGLSSQDTLSKFMIPDPVTASLEDSSLSVMATLAELGFKWIPVVDGKESRRIEGFVSVRGVLAHVWSKSGLHPGEERPA